MNTITQPTDRSKRLAQIEKWVPGLHALRTYQRAWLPRDLIAGVILCTLLVPQGMAYAELAGLPAITGLYTTVVCLFAYAAFGPYGSESPCYICDAAPVQLIEQVKVGA